ncbi:hypothetical protein L3X38_025561 [Prunus dulcis]|uniref:Uncharacterized protein n=1 Tax=Prunus dulcis TaxID=3755 RepID=A0AAD4W340_PRUDU|nr:hypothetical protein L3X38_025561 [Prunus dulcis]
MVLNPTATKANWKEVLVLGVHEREKVEYIGLTVDLDAKSRGEIEREKEREEAFPKATWRDVCGGRVGLLTELGGFVVVVFNASSRSCCARLIALISSSALVYILAFVPTMFVPFYDDDTLVSRVDFMVPKRLCTEAYSDKPMETGVKYMP